MKRLFIYCLLLIVLLPGCLELEQTTTINKDGSGTLQSDINMDQLAGLYKMMAQMKAEKAGDTMPAEAEVKMDTLIYMKHHSDTSSLLTEKEKELLREMTISLKLNTEGGRFRISTKNRFNTQADLNALVKLMNKEAFDKVFDKALDIPGLNTDEEKETEEPVKIKNDNIFSLAAPAFFNCQYEPGNIVCKVNTAKHQAELRKMKKDGMDVNQSTNRDMLSKVTFTNRYVLPAKVKLMTGGSLTKETPTELVQTGNLYSLYKNPKKYEYTIKY